MRRTFGVVAGVDLLSKAGAAALGVGYRNDAYALGVAGGARWLLALVSFAALAAAVRISRTRIDELALALIVAGAAGNLIDRVATGAVHDFIPAGPIVFNVADIALLAGIALAVVKRRVSAKPDPASGVATTPLH
ncbi:MAG TPA: signal peptidase II [Acidimicrobiia bacterium]|jgi:signal peptidase II|nr:signal peptidase II [Acidimicrobiia bacterium]